MQYRAMIEATKLFNDLEKCQQGAFKAMSEKEIIDCSIAIIANHLIKAHAAGYNAARDFYIDKEPGWGKEKVDEPT